MIDHYFRNLQDLITKTSFISTVNLHMDRRSVTIGFVRGDLTFEDGSKLHFREYVHTIDNEVVRFTYVYQFLSSNGNLIFRYDNSSHYPKLENAPHHKHNGEKDVISSQAPDLESVLKEIGNKFMP